MVDVLAGCEIDANRNTLHHLDVVAGRVLRREQAEAFTRRGSQAVDIAFERAVERVDVDVDRLPGSIRRSWASLKLAVTQTSSSGTTASNDSPGCTRCPGSTLFLPITPLIGAVILV
jgi:hypothetical protein